MVSDGVQRSVRGGKATGKHRKDKHQAVGDQIQGDIVPSRQRLPAEQDAFTLLVYPGAQEK
jgi:hypothetical protein